MIEVVAATTDIAWAEMRDIVMSMESVLLKYSGLKTTKQGKLKRYIVNPNGDSKHDHVVVSGLVDDPSELERKRSENPWLPPDLDWFIQRAWENPEKLKELQALKITLQLPHRLDVLKQLVVSSDMRQFPTLWTLSYSNECEAPEIELRIHSDLSGVCYHVPLRVAIPSDFVMRHADLIQDGVSILSVVSSLIPIDIAKTAVELALSASQTALGHAQSVSSILAKAGLIRGKEKSAMEFGMTVQSRMLFLRELLKLHDPPFDDLKIGEISNLRCAADENGCYVWVHPRELEEMSNHLIPCDPPKPPMTPPRTSTSISICVTRLLRKGHAKSRKNIYCEWEVVHQSRRADFGKTEEAADLEAELKWSSQPEKLVNVLSITMLQESTLKISVKQSHRFAKFLCDTMIGHGEVHLKDHVGTDCSNSKTVEIEIDLAGKKILQPSTVICEISIV